MCRYRRRGRARVSIVFEESEENGSHVDSIVHRNRIGRLEARVAGSNCCERVTGKIANARWTRRRYSKQEGVRREQDRCVENRRRFSISKTLLGNRTNWNVAKSKRRTRRFDIPCFIGSRAICTTWFDCDPITVTLILEARTLITAFGDLSALPLPAKHGRSLMSRSGHRSVADLSETKCHCALIAMHR